MPDAGRVIPGLAAFSLIAAVMAAIGRAHEGGIPVWYAMLVTPLQAAPRIEAGWKRPGFTAGLLGCMVLLLGSEVLGARAAITEARTIRGAIAAFRDGASGPEIARVVYPDPRRAARIMHIHVRKGSPRQAKNTQTFSDHDETQ